MPGEAVVGGMIKAGELDRRISIERKAVASDGYGGEVETWTDIARPWAKVINGSGTERRAAAQVSATLSATFRVRSNAVTIAVTPVDRIQYDNALWDISSNVPYGRDGRDITATRVA